MSLLLHSFIQRYTHLSNRHHPINFPGPRIFNSVEHSQTPTFTQIHQLIQSIFDKRRLHIESGIIALILLNRTNIKIHSQNWMRMVLISLLLANKHCEDIYSVYNAKFVGIIPHVENLEINILELEFLKYLKYRLHIETETYQEFYSKLQKFFPIFEKNEDDSNTEETDSVEEEENIEVDEYRNSAARLHSPTESPLSLGKLDQNLGSSGDWDLNTASSPLSLGKLGQILGSSGDWDLKTASSPLAWQEVSQNSMTGYLDHDEISCQTIATLENLWRDFNFDNDLSLLA